MTDEATPKKPETGGKSWTKEVGDRSAKKEALRSKFYKEFAQLKLEADPTAVLDDPASKGYKTFEELAAKSDFSFITNPDEKKFEQGKGWSLHEILDNYFEHNGGVSDPAVRKKEIALSLYYLTQQKVNVDYLNATWKVAIQGAKLYVTDEKGEVKINGAFIRKPKTGAGDAVTPPRPPESPPGTAPNPEVMKPGEKTAVGVGKTPSSPHERAGVSETPPPPHETPAAGVQPEVLRPGFGAGVTPETPREAIVHPPARTATDTVARGVQATPAATPAAAPAAAPVVPPIAPPVAPPPATVVPEKVELGKNKEKVLAELNEKVGKALGVEFTNWENENDTIPWKDIDTNALVNAFNGITREELKDVSKIVLSQKLKARLYTFPDGGKNITINPGEPTASIRNSIKKAINELNPAPEEYIPIDEQPGWEEFKTELDKKYANSSYGGVQITEGKSGLYITQDCMIEARVNRKDSIDQARVEIMGGNQQSLFIEDIKDETRTGLVDFNLVDTLGKYYGIRVVHWTDQEYDWKDVRKNLNSLARAFYLVDKSKVNKDVKVVLGRKSIPFDREGLTEEANNNLLIEIDYDESPEAIRDTIEEGYEQLAARKEVMRRSGILTNRFGVYISPWSDLAKDYDWKNLLNNFDNIENSLNKIDKNKFTYCPPIILASQQMDVIDRKIHWKGLRKNANNDPVIVVDYDEDPDSIKNTIEKELDEINRKSRMDVMQKLYNVTNSQLFDFREHEMDEYNWKEVYDNAGKIEEGLKIFMNGGKNNLPHDILLRIKPTWNNEIKKGWMVSTGNYIYLDYREAAPQIAETITQGIQGIRTFNNQ